MTTQLCACGCGRPTKIATHKRSERGHITGQPMKYLPGHGGNRQHGKSFTPTYYSWASMKQRCLNPRSHKWPAYGGRGITVCQSWLTFENFLADMGERPPGTTLDRYPNGAGNYEPGNCRWADARTQGANTNKSRLLCYRGKTQHVAQWARELGLTSAAITNRLGNGWTVERTLSTPLGRQGVRWS